MKRFLILSMFIMLLTFGVGLFASNPKVCTYLVTYADGSAPALPAGTGTATASNSLYLEAWLLSNPTDIKNSQTNYLNVKFGTYNNPTGTYAYVNLQVFAAWSNGNVLHYKVTDNVHGGIVVNSNDANCTISNATFKVTTPMIINWPSTDPNPALATNPVPENHATNVAISTATIGWTYTHDAAYSDPNGYRVYFGTNSNVESNTSAFVSGMATHTMPVTLAYATHYYWKVVPTTAEAKKALASISARAIKNGAKGDASGALTWDFTTEDAPILNKDIQITATIPNVKIYRNTIDTGFKTPHTFTEAIGASVTYAVENIPVLVTPVEQTITVATNQTLTFTYTPRPNDVAGGSVFAPAAVPVVIPVTPVLSGTESFSVTLTPAVPALFVITTFAPTAKGNYEGYQNVWNVFTVWTSDTAALDGTDVEVQYANDAPYEVAIHWGGVANGFYPHAGPWSGYLYNGGPATSLSQPLGAAPFIHSTYIDGTPDNTLKVGPLPVYAAKGEGTLELILNDGTHTLPVELSSFTAIATAQMFVNLQWTTESETNNLGFNVLRSSDSNVANAEQVNLSMISGTNGSVQHTYSFTDREVAAGTSYYYWLQSTDFDGTVHMSNYVMVTTNTNNTPVTPVVNVTSLQNAYPNPFQMGRVTNIGVNVKNGETADLTIYNVLGKVVKTATFQSGTTNYQWDGKDYKGAACGSGIYFYKLTSPTHNETKKMVVVK